MQPCFLIYKRIRKVFLPASKQSCVQQTSLKSAGVCSKRRLCLLDSVWVIFPSQKNAKRENKQKIQRKDQTHTQPVSDFFRGIFNTGSETEDESPGCSLRSAPQSLSSVLVDGHLLPELSRQCWRLGSLQRWDWVCSGLRLIDQLRCVQVLEKHNSRGYLVQLCRLKGGRPRPRDQSLWLFLKSQVSGTYGTWTQSSWLPSTTIIPSTTCLPEHKCHLLPHANGHQRG